MPEAARPISRDGGRVSDLDLADARHLIEDLRRLDPALRTLIDARIACEICRNPRHEWHGEAHGDVCQNWPFASADAYENAALHAEELERLLRDRDGLVEKLAAAAQTFFDRPNLPDSEADVFEDEILEPLRAATAEPDADNRDR